MAGASSVAHKTSRLIAGRYPAPGTSPVADAIRARRGARGITPLDAALLHVPPVAGGWNSLLGAVRTQGKLPGDVRELMILRVAAINKAAFEWIHHEHVGRDAGLTTAQLYIIRDVATPLPPSPGILSALQSSALMFADASTRNVKVEEGITDALLRDLRHWVKQGGKVGPEEPEEEVTGKVQDLLVEAAAVVATYNMVSRFLVSLDVAGLSDDPVPWPVERNEHLVEVPSAPNSPHKHTIHATTLISSPSSPWVALTNSLLTTSSMWSYLVPYLLSANFNVLLHSQRGHGRSTLPTSDASARSAPAPRTTIPSLAADLAHLLSHLNIQTPLHSVIGVSQGGAAALAFSTLAVPSTTNLPLAKSIVACDTSARTPQGNALAWASRIGLVFGGVSGEEVLRLTSVAGGGVWNGKDAQGGDIGKGIEYARRVGMDELAGVTVARWFPAPSKCSDEAVVAPGGSVQGCRAERAEWLRRMVRETDVDGFIQGAGALSPYNLLENDREPPQEHSPLFASNVPKVLLVAGSLDGNGRVGAGLGALAQSWNESGRAGAASPVACVQIDGAGHLPMVDETEKFWEVVGKFLNEVEN